jgi:chemotaxis methyl-accepting protein methylase
LFVGIDIGGPQEHVLMAHFSALLRPQGIMVIGRSGQVCSLHITFFFESRQLLVVRDDAGGLR